MVNQLVAVSSQHDDASVTPSVAYSVELSAKIQKCQSMVEKARKTKARKVPSHGTIKYSKSDNLTGMKDKMVTKSQLKEDIIDARWKEAQLRADKDIEEERRAVQQKVDALLRDPTEGLIIGNPRSHVSTDLQTASELYKKQVERFTPEYESMSSSDDYDDQSSMVDYMDRREDWITSPRSAEGWNCLCCLPGEDFSGEDYAVEVYARENFRRQAYYG